jgi:hypothetical protein
MPPSAAQACQLLPIALAAVLGCGTACGPTESRLPETVLHLPNDLIFQLEASPDSAMFASTSVALYRAVSPNFLRWERIAETNGEFVTRLYAPSKGVVFALSRTCNAVFRWDSAGGWRELETPVRDSVWSDGDSQSCFRLSDIWGRSEHEVYVVGSGALVLSYDGNAWRIETTELPAAQPPSDPAHIHLWAVTGDDNGTFAGATRHLLRRTPNGWVIAADFPDSLPPHCEYGMPVATAAAVVLGWNDCLLAFSGDRVSLVDATLRRMADGIYRGRAQRDGSALFWSYSGDIVVVRGDMRVTSMRVPSLGAVGGAVALGPDLFIAGTSRTGGAVVRVSKP